MLSPTRLIAFWLVMSPSSAAALSDAKRQPVILEIGSQAVEANGLTRKLLAPKTPCMELHVGLSLYEKSGALTSSSLYGPAKYRQAWCFSETGDAKNFRRALAKAIAISANEIPGTTPESRQQLRRAAIDDLVWAHAQSEDAEGAHDSFIETVGEAEAIEMSQSLALIYRARGDHSDAVKVYAELLQRYPEGEHAVYQRTCLLAATQKADPAADISTEVEDLLRMLAEARKKPDHDRGGEATIEEAVRHGVLHSHVHAKKLKDASRQKALERVTDLYGRYLASFGERPTGDGIHYPAFMSFYLAGALLAREQFDEAAETYGRVIALVAGSEDDKERELERQASEGVWLARREAVEKLERAAPPSLDGDAPKPIPTAHQQLLDAGQRHLVLAGARDGRRLEISYQLARVHYTFNHFVPAKEGFEGVIASHPDSAVACLAARLLLDIVHRTGDPVALRDAAAGVRRQERLACDAEDQAFVAAAEQRAALKIIKRDLEDAGKDADAAAAYLFFYENHKDRLTGRTGVIALYNAAVLLERAGEGDEARAARQMLVDAYPADDVLVQKAKAGLASPTP